jgi:hypothetical protein
MANILAAYYDPLEYAQVAFWAEVALAKPVLYSQETLLSPE